MLTWKQFIENINPKICVIMRGLPGAGKSSSVQKILNKYGGSPDGHVFSTDNFWIPETRAKRKAGEHVGDQEERAEYTRNYNPNKSRSAHINNLNEFKKAIDQGVTPVIVDNTNFLMSYMRPYAEYAQKAGYQILVKYPESEWWKKYYPYLSNKNKYSKELDEFARILANKNQHGVPLEVIKDMIARWHHTPKMEDILKS